MKTRSVLLTGASGGIGQATAAALVAAGHQVMLAGRNETALKALAQRLGPRAGYAVADITQAAGRETLVAIARAKGVDTLINNAGINDFGLFADCDSIETQIGTNLLAPMLLTQALLPLLQDTADARIVNIGSTLGSIGHPGYVAYCASKAGLRGFTEALERELADTTVRVQYIAPRATDTAINTAAVRALNAELGSHTDAPEAVAAAIVKALHTGRARTWIGWPEKFFVRLNALLPGLVGNSLEQQLPTIKRHARHGD